MRYTYADDIEELYAKLKYALIDITTEANKQYPSSHLLYGYICYLHGITSMIYNPYQFWEPDWYSRFDDYMTSVLNEARFAHNRYYERLGVGVDF